MFVDFVGSEFCWFVCGFLELGVVDYFERIFGFVYRMILGAEFGVFGLVRRRVR